MRSWLKEPLIHFLLAGGLLFAAYAWFHQGEGGDARVVRITAEELGWLKETWARQWHRPPDEREFRNLVNDYLKEVLLALEARELGLDENDTVVRRRLAQKMAFLVQDTASLAEPAETELREFYDVTRAHYRIPARISFTQIFFDTESSARQGLKEIATRRPAELGDRILLERHFEGADEQAVASLFGREFAETVFALEPGSWHGPVESGYGFHLVRIGGRQAARQRPFEEVRTQVREAWQRSRQAEAGERYFAELLKKYDVIVDGGSAAPLATRRETGR
ncbi:peptidyl-prolyl cis-trans isomerase [Methylohalobius crimeensis]|uniref:peptidylprolyl isomerase n=1 Tax=Methylohalobius crimeensis TaxID=244365 RepID=UPI0003B3A0E6|nr:peptidylprolyl isomerase [Methylohalobius crimeensis]